VEQQVTAFHSKGISQFFSNCLHTKYFHVTMFETSQVQNYTPNLQNHTLFLSLWLSFQFLKTLFSKHYTQFST